MNFWRRIPIIPAAVSLAVLISGGFAVQPIRDAASLADVPEVYLIRSLGYVAIAPISNILDTLTLLSARQHIALLASIVLLFVAWRAYRAWRGTSTVRQHVRATAGLLGVIVIAYTAGAILPRPMVALGSDNANILKIDFHSHTSDSHDGYQSVEALREWHRRAGYDVAYVTDHAAVSAAERGMANNPRPAGTGVTLLQSIETTWNGEHVSIPGAQREYRGLLTANLADVDTQSLRIASFIRAREPVVIWNHPRDLTRLTLARQPGVPGIRAIEIVNGAPKDIDTERRNRTRLVEMASAADVSLTSGSDNHGLGRTAPAWTLMLIVDWRSLEADPLARAIDRVIREGRYQSTKVVERRIADPGTRVMPLAASVVTVLWRMLTTLSNDERVVWLIWTWAFVAIAAFRRAKGEQQSGAQRRPST